MRTEGRLFVIIREAVGKEFESRIALAQHVADLTPAEFTYNRLDERCVMTARSIVHYVSFLYFLGIIASNGSENLVCTIDREPIAAGAELIVKLKCIEKLEESGFTADKLKATFKRLVSGRNFVLPTQRDLYQALGLSIDEKEFVQMVSLGAVREHYGYSIVTRRMMIPG